MVIQHHELAPLTTHRSAPLLLPILYYHHYHHHYHDYDQYDYYYYYYY